MKLPAFDYAKMQWDVWRAFHVVHKYRTFIQFDTGEFVVCCHHHWSPEERKVYGDLHIQIAGTDDPGCPRLYVPGQDKPIPKSHLNHNGMQVLLLDLDHKRAVGLSPGLTQGSAPHVPERFTKDSRHISAYYSGPDAMPTGSPVTKHYPQPLTTTQRTHISELADACKVWLGMQPESEIKSLRHEHRNMKAPVKAPVGAFTESRFSELTISLRTAIAVNGFEMIVREEYPWLRFDAA